MSGNSKKILKFSDTIGNNFNKTKFVLDGNITGSYRTYKELDEVRYDRRDYKEYCRNNYWKVKTHFNATDESSSTAV